MRSQPTGFRNVLFCPMSDRGGPAAVRRAVAAIDAPASLTITGVVAEPSRFDALVNGAEHVDAVLAAGHDVARRRVGRCATAARQAGPSVAVTEMVEIGHPALALVKRAIAAEHDLVAVSVDDDVDTVTVRRLFRKSPCPVWVIRPTRARHQRVIAAVDADPEQASLNRAIMDAAASIAGDDGELLVVNVWELFGEATMRSSAFVQVDADEIQRRRRDLRAAHERALVELVADRRDADRWDVHVVEGPAGPTIAQVVNRQRATSLVIGTVARSGLSGLVMGNTAERLIDEVSCSVLAVKPDDFVSPVGR